ncbi:MAG: cob(I)yrinic acid a,c-diamide adenosyltransferase [Myxococcales bacterium]|nr:cob(I)yrinic acid a,c-diamide adenosyltransferase [Myxococcales bacterium]
MKIYTKTGDAGLTGLYGGERISKASARVAAYGDVDELNSAIGIALASGLDPAAAAVLATVQSELFDLGAELATAESRRARGGSPGLEEPSVEALERAIDASEARLSPLQSFVLPGGTLSAAHLHLARTICRRAERALVALHGLEPLRPELLRYLNRLSDLLFSLARLENARAELPDVPWVGRDRRLEPS